MEKTYKPGVIESVKALDNLQKQRFIGFDGKYCKNGDTSLGVSDASTDEGQLVPVAIYGILLIEAGSAIVQGGKVTSDGQGRAKPAGSNDAVNGYALDEAQGSGEIIRIAKGI